MDGFGRLIIGLIVGTLFGVMLSCLIVAMADKQSCPTTTQDDFECPTVGCIE